MSTSRKPRPAQEAPAQQVLEVQEHRPVVKVPPRKVRLVADEVIDGLLTFTVHDERSGVPRLIRYWLPDAAAAYEQLDGTALDLAVDGSTEARLRLALMCLDSSGVDEETREVLMALPLLEIGRLLGTWSSMPNQDGTSAGESSSSAHA